MSKPIVLTDDSVINSYGFRVMTAGGELTDYLKNPVLLYDHTRRAGVNDRDIILPIGKMTDLRSDGSRIIGTPEFDLEDKFAAEISRKYDKDIMNMECNVAFVSFSSTSSHFFFDAKCFKLEQF